MFNLGYRYTARSEGFLSKLGLFFVFLGAMLVWSQIVLRGAPHGFRLFLEEAFRSAFHGLSSGSPPSYLLLCGGVLIFRHGGVVFDKRKDLAMKWWGFLIPFQRKTVPLDSLTKVTITQRSHYGEHGQVSYRDYEVHVRSAEMDFSIGSCFFHRAARRKANRIARFLLLPMYDYNDFSHLQTLPDVIRRKR